MPSYRYRRLDNHQAQHDGVIEAESLEQARQQLLQQPGMLLSLKVVPAWQQQWRRQRRQLTPAEQLQITQQLATLLEAGQTLEWSLQTLLAQSPGGRMQQLLQQLLQAIQGGESFSSALSASQQFSKLYLAMVRAGESSGTLDEVFVQLAGYLERRQKLRSRVINALIYPAFLIIGVLGSLALLLAYVVPQFVPIFVDLNVDLPLITQWIMRLGQLLNQQGLTLLAGAMVLLLLLSALMRKEAVQQRVDRFWLKTKGLGNLLNRLDTARFSQTLGTLLAHQVALLPALHIARDVCVNRAIRAQIEQVTLEVKNGGKLAAALTAQKCLPTLARQMVDVGERSGTLATMLLKISNIYEESVQHSFERMLALLVPILTVVMALLVAVIMLAIMLPLMSLTNHL